MITLWVQSAQFSFGFDSPGLPYVHVATHVVHVGSTLQPHGISHAGQIEHDEYPNGHWSGQADDQAGHPEQVVLMTCSLSRGRAPRAWFGFGFPWVVLKVGKAQCPKMPNFDALSKFGLKMGKFGLNMRPKVTFLDTVERTATV